MESAPWSLLEITIFSAAFLFSVAACVILAAWGVLRRSGSALALSAALVLPSAFFLIFQPILTYVDELPYWLGHYTLWTSIFLSPLVALAGTVKQSRTILLMSAALAVPFGVWFLFYPGTRFYILLPALHLVSAATVRTRAWLLTLIMLAFILGLEALFLVGLGGWGLLFGSTAR